MTTERDILNSYCLVAASDQASLSPVKFIPAAYMPPRDVSCDLVFKLLQLVAVCDANDIPRARIWQEDDDGILPKLIRSQSTFSGINTKHVRVQIVREAILDLATTKDTDVDSAGDGLDHGSGEDAAGEDSAGEDSAGGGDAGGGDAGEGDAGEDSAGEGDAGGGDAGGGDAGGGDAGEGDAGEGDAGEGDAGEGDAGEDSACEDAAYKDGAHEDGAREDAAHEDGAGEDAAHEDGAGEDAAHEDGAGEDAAHEDNAGEDAAREDDAHEDDADNDVAGGNGTGLPAQDGPANNAKETDAGIPGLRKRTVPHAQRVTKRRKPNPQHGELVHKPARELPLVLFKRPEEEPAEEPEDAPFRERRRGPAPLKGRSMVAPPPEGLITLSVLAAATIGVGRWYYSC